MQHQSIGPENHPDSRESRDPLMQQFKEMRSSYNLSKVPYPSTIESQILEARAKMRGQSGVNACLESAWCKLKEVGQDLPHDLAQQYAALFRQYGSVHFRDIAAKLADFGSVNENARRWCRQGAVGASSLAMYHHFIGNSFEQEVPPHYPHDADDFGRCMKLIDAVPQWRERIPELADLSRRWGAIAENWDAIERRLRAGDTDGCTAILRETMNRALDPVDEFTVERVERARALVRAAVAQLSDKDDEPNRAIARAEQMTLVAATDLANTTAELLLAAGIRKVWVSAHTDDAVVVVANRYPEYEFCNKVSAEDFTHGPGGVTVVVDRSDPRLESLLAG